MAILTYPPKQHQAIFLTPVLFQAVDVKVYERVLSVLAMSYLETYSGMSILLIDMVGLTGLHVA